MEKRIRVLIIVVLFACGFFSACTKDNFDMDRMSGNVMYDGSFAIPIAYSDIAFYQVLDLLDTTIPLQDNDEGYMSFFYDGYVESRPVQDLLNIGAQSYSLSVPFSDMAMRGVRSGNQFYYTTEEKISFKLMKDGEENDEAEIDSLALNSATLEYSLNSSFGLSSKFVIEFPSIRKNGLPLKDSITLYSTDETDHKVLSLAGYTIDLTTTDRHFNEIPVKISMLLDCSTPPTLGNLDVDVSFRDFNYKGMYGYFGYNELFIQSDTIKINLFKENAKYNLERVLFVKPRLTVHYWNSYGVPAMFYFNKLETYLRNIDQIQPVIPNNGVNFPLTAGNPYIINVSPVPGVEAEDSLELNKDNSNLVTIVPNRPTWLHFEAVAATNPGNNGARPHNNYITDDSKLRSKIDFELPLWGSLGLFEYTDTANVDISQITGNYPISRMAVHILMDNAMPVEAKAQVYLTDENYNVIDSLIHDNDPILFKPAPIDANGKIINRVKTSKVVELTKAQLESMANCRHLLIKMRANTDGADDGRIMKIYREYGVKINLGVDFDLDVNGNINSLSNN